MNSIAPAAPKRRLSRALGASLVIGLGLVLLLSWWKVNVPQLRSRPSVTFKTLTGERLTLPDAARRVNLVYFWSVTCSVCREEIPALLALHTRFAGQDLRIVGIAMPYDPPNAVVNTTRALGLPFATALDLHGAQGRAFGEVTATPTTFLLDRTGRVVQHIVGRFDADDLGSRIAVELARPR